MKAEAGGGELSIEGGKCCVLVVDDDDATLEAIAEVLVDSEFLIVVASGGDHAWFTLHSGAIRPDVVLLDMMMPRGTGLKLLERMRGDAAVCEIPVVVMSAGGDKEFAYTSAAAGRLRKPFSRDQLLAELRSALG